MKFVLIHPDYPEFLSWLYGQRPGLADQSYEGQLRVRSESLFGEADFISGSLRDLQHEAWDLYPSNSIMQAAWERAEGRYTSAKRGSGFLRRLSGYATNTLASKGRGPLQLFKPLMRPLFRPLRAEDERIMLRVLADQIRVHDPDVVINYALGGIRGSFLRDVMPNGRLLVGQIASPLPRDGDYESYDLIVSSLPNLVNRIRRYGGKADLIRLGFEPRVLDYLKGADQAIPVSFVGSVTWAHASRAKLLEYLAAEAELEIWGYLAGNFSRRSHVRRNYKGPAWGLRMYEILAGSRITVNHHIDAAESYANNMRLFEATGVGTMLITDWKENLHEMFELEKEVVTYRTHEECVEKVKYYLEHEGEREGIARAGQMRTLSQHTNRQRVEELLGMLESSGTHT